MVPARPEPPFSPSNALVQEPTMPSTFDDDDDIPATNRPCRESHKYLEEELETKLLENIGSFLWMAGLKHPKKAIRPLHRQKVVGRKIVFVEDVALHLTWQSGIIFIKPIPKCILHYDFYLQFIAPNAAVENLVIGFLSTYLHLIRYETDFLIAREMLLVPRDTTWSHWLAFSKELKSTLSRRLTQGFANRYDYGELRLNRLNLIMFFFRGRWNRRYATLETSYMTLFQPWIILLTAVVFAFWSVGLSAFQVMTGAGDAPQGVSSAGYWFAIVTLLGLGATALALTLWFIALFINNLLFALSKADSQEGCPRRVKWFTWNLPDWMGRWIKRRARLEAHAMSALAAAARA